VSEPGRTPPFRFPKAQRLTRPVEFLRVKAEGKSQRGAALIVAVLDTSSASKSRVGFVTSKRVGGAVVRNRIRRRLREIVRRHPEAVPGGIWMVVIARPAAARARSAVLEDEWLRLTSRVLS
jgi:ribonuclease P protein component